MSWGTPGWLVIAAIVLVAAAALFGWLFVRRQLRAEAPMLDMRLFRHSTFTGALLVNLLSVVALVGFLYFITQHLQLIVALARSQSKRCVRPRPGV